MSATPNNKAIMTGIGYTPYPSVDPGTSARSVRQRSNKPSGKTDWRVKGDENDCKREAG